MKKKLPVAISEEEFVSLIRSTKKESHKLAFLLGFGSGLRVSEVLRLEPRDINLMEKKILVRQGKGSKDRVVPLPKGFRERHINLLPFGISPRALQVAFKRTAKRCGILNHKPTAHFHSLRHGFATNSIAKNIPLHHVRTLLGHSNISTTNIYLELNPKEALKSYEELF